MSMTGWPLGRVLVFSGSTPGRKTTIVLRGLKGLRNLKPPLRRCFLLSGLSSNSMSTPGTDEGKGNRNMKAKVNARCRPHLQGWARQSAPRDRPRACSRKMQTARITALERLSSVPKVGRSCSSPSLHLRCLSCPVAPRPRLRTQ